MPFHNLLGDAADRSRHDRDAAGQGLEDGGREGVGPGRVEVEGRRPGSTGRLFGDLSGRGRTGSRRRRSVPGGRLRRGWNALTEDI